jgi:hypothetical protein
MSRSELTDAYVSGRISRRSFVRGMVALGASVPVAMALADKVSAAPSGAPRVGRNANSDVYPDPYPYPPHHHHHHHYPKPSGGTTYTTTVTTLPATGVAEQDKSSVVAPLAAGAAAAALVALRMRQPKKVEGEA